MSISLVAALGNPGREYESTRHNLGWIVVDALARRERLAWQHQARFDAMVARWDAFGRTLWLVKPQSYMNDSGRPVQAFARFHQIAPAAIAAVYDEVAVPLGRVKVTGSGSAGGHNGVASLIEHLGPDFIRFRLGIGPKVPAEMDLSDFVLAPFSSEQLLLLQQNLNSFLQGLDVLLADGVAPAMNQLNRRPNHETEQT